jgi:ribonucleotide reductase alpha subunit
MSESGATPLASPLNKRGQVLPKRSRIGATGIGETGTEERRVSSDRRQEVEDLYKQAQKFLLHELTEDKLSRLRELVRRKGTKPNVA